MILLAYIDINRFIDDKNKHENRFYIIFSTFPKICFIGLRRKFEKMNMRNKHGKLYYDKCRITNIPQKSLVTARRVIDGYFLYIILIVVPQIVLT